MVIHHDSLPFDVTFNVGNNYIFQSHSIDFFTDCEDDEVAINVSIKEYTQVEVILKAEEGSTARLYVDGFDMLMRSSGEDDFPTIEANKAFKMYAIQDSNVYFPLIPGRCRIVVYADDKAYYSYINVEPKRLQQEDLDQLRMDIEAISSGLARELMATNINAVLAKDKNIKPLNFDRFNALKSAFNQLQYNLADITSNPLTAVEKQYQLMPEHKARNMDTKSAAWLVSEQGQMHNLSKSNRTMLCPVPVLEHNILPNQWIRHMVNDFIQMLYNTNTELQDVIPHYQEVLRKMRMYNEVGVKIQQYQHTLDKLVEIQTESLRYMSYFKSILQNNTFRTVDQLRKKEIPMILTREQRYNYIYALYRDLIADINVQKDSKIAFQWKTTDRLYEYWCLIKLIEILKEMGFKLLNDIVQTSYVLDTINVIDDDTCIRMEKDDIQLVISYNTRIPKHRKDARRDKLDMWSRTKHNKPDIRVDVMKSNEYQHSIILDAKYQDPKGVWDKKKSGFSDRPSVMEQLNDYKIGIARVDRDESAIKQVFALCPENVNGEILYDEDDDYYITVATLRPSSDTTDLKGLLGKYMAC